MTHIQYSDQRTAINVPCAHSSAPHRPATMDTYICCSSTDRRDITLAVADASCRHAEKGELLKGEQLDRTAIV